jgi:hypothetical protein
MGLLAASDGSGASCDLLAGHCGALGQESSRFLLDRDALQPRLHAEPFGHPVVEIPDDHVGHGSILKAQW